MFRKMFFVIVLVLGFCVSLSGEASALLRGGTGGSSCGKPLCLKCVDGFVTATGLKNTDKIPTQVLLTVFVYRDCVNGTITEGGDCDGGTWVYPQWVVACGNPGTNSWTSPGINLVNYEGTLEGSQFITPEIVNKNGRADVEVETLLSDYLKTELRSTCPNPNWVVVDAGPCDKMDALFEEVIDLEGTCYIRSRLWYYDCKIDNCQNVQWNFVNQSFMPTPYSCSSMNQENLSQNPQLYSEAHPGYTCPGIPIPGN